MMPLNFAQLVKGSALSLNGQTIIVEIIEHLPRDGILGERILIVASGRKCSVYVTKQHTKGKQIMETKDEIQKFLISKGHSAFKALEIAIAFKRGETHAIDWVKALVAK